MDDKVSLQPEPDPAPPRQQEHGELEKRLVQLADLLIERLEGQEEEYEYSFESGWHEEDTTFAEQMTSLSPADRLELVEQLIQRYSEE